jgi:hypothetical protein
MIRKIEEASTDSWSPRAPAQVGPEVDSHRMAACAADPQADRPQGGWDPMEVWLRHIAQPRRLRQRATPADSRRRS